MGLELFEAHFFDTFFRRIKKFLQIGWKSRIKFSVGRRQKKYETPTDVLPRKIILLFSEGRQQEKILYLPTSSRAELSLYAGRRQDNKH